MSAEEVPAEVEVVEGMGKVGASACSVPLGRFPLGSGAIDVVLDIRVSELNPNTSPCAVRISFVQHAMPALSTDLRGWWEVLDCQGKTCRLGEVLNSLRGGPTSQPQPAPRLYPTEPSRIWSRI